MNAQPSTNSTPRAMFPRTQRHRTRATNNLALGLLFTSPFLLGTTFFLLLPILASIALSFTDYSLLNTPVYVGLDNYRELAGDALFWTVVRNTAAFALCSVTLSTTLSVALAMLLEQRLRGLTLARAIVFLPTLVPAVASAVSWLWLFNTKFGLINSALAALSIPGPDWLGDRSLAMPALIFASLWVVGSAVMVCSAALKDVPQSLLESADLDGVGPWTKFRHVTLPIISPGVLFNAVMSLIWSSQIFAAPYIITKGGPERSTTTYAMYIYNNAFVYGRMGYASALAWVQILLILLAAVALIRFTKKFVYYRAA